MRTKSTAEEAWLEAYCPVRGEPGDRKLNIKAHMFGVSAVVITPPPSATRVVRCSTISARPIE